ncbi:natterin-3-like [Scomber scombrus]|uniref:natterin-3-like n=1 Tax=Scomber scombrus TaxID=13677 RepID=UPI002DDA77C8|nr:natterin-3-like [Scomber scombrus]
MPEDKTPDITSNRTLRQKRSSSIPGATSNLKWVYRRSGHHVPDGSVLYHNPYENRYDYICRCGCSAGFNTRGSNTCNYAYGDSERKCTSFNVLVNKDNFEYLDWRDGSYGSVPTNSIKTCSNGDTYIGKNKYGLGKVSVKHKAFFLPWRGSEYWYKYYQVLTFSKKVAKVQMSDVKYKVNEAKKFSYPPEVMTKATTINHQCRTVKKIPHLYKEYEEEKRWDSSTEISVGVTASFEAKIPFVGTTGIEMSASTTKSFSKGNSITVKKSLGLDVQVWVPPNHTCSVRIMGHKYKTVIPYTALLTRTYPSGSKRSTTISGVFNGVNVVDFVTHVDRCIPIPNVKPCPLKKN